jgi:hypothetical protein
VSLIVNGYCKEVLNQLPMEFAVEAQKLLAVSLEGSVGLIPEGVRGYGDLAAGSRDHISQTEFDVLVPKCLKASKDIGNFMRYLRNSDMKGSKFVRSAQ